MPPGSFHHGNLRAVLLERAEAVLRDGGVEQLSLRDLARQAGVSHGAPRSHFVDRRALLDALAEQGFDRLTERVGAAAARPGTVHQRLRAVALAHVGFAVDDAALMELMFATKVDGRPGPVHDAAVRLFRLLDEVMGGAPGDRAGEGARGGTDDGAHDGVGAVTDARGRFARLFAATVQGTATLVTSGRITRAQAEVLVADATEALLASELGRRVLPDR